MGILTRKRALECQIETENESTKNHNIISKKRRKSQSRKNAKAQRSSLELLEQPQLSALTATSPPHHLHHQIGHVNSGLISPPQSLSPSRVASALESGVTNVLNWSARFTNKFRFGFGFNSIAMSLATSQSPTHGALSPIFPSQSSQQLEMFQFTAGCLESPPPMALNSPSLNTCSSPLSDMSRSPSPPSDLAAYPSPMSSQLSSVPSSIAASPAPDSRDDDRPPTKRRRTSYEPKPRVTQHLDLQTDDVHILQKDPLRTLLKAIENRRKIVVVAGAGISVSAGIPDFRSSKGLFKSLKKQHNLKSSGKDLFDASVYKDGDSTESFHQMVRQLASLTKEAKPTPFHHLLATLADEGRLLRLYSQNVDGIDTSLQPLETCVPLPRKGPWPRTIQLHGGLQKMVCSKCNNMQDLDPHIFDGPETPTCELCVAADNARTEHAGKRSHGVGRLRPRMVLYNEHNPDDEAIGAVVKSDMRTRPDCLIVVGTTLKIPGVKRIVKEMSGIIQNRRDGVTIWINRDPPPPTKDYDWDLIVKGPCDSVAHHAAMRRWDEPKSEAISDEEAKQLLASNSVQVIVPPTPQKNKDLERLMLTPVSSRSGSLPPQAGDNALNIVFEDMKVNAASQSKIPTKRGKTKTDTKTASQKARSRVKFIKKKVDPAAGTTKIGFKQSKGITKVTQSKKTSAPSSRNGTPNLSPTKLTPMRPLSPVDAKINALPADHYSGGEEMDSPPFSPITPAKFERLPRKQRPNRSPKMAIASLLN